MVVVVAIGAHPDDIEGGCFGTLAKFKKAGNEVVIMLLTKGGRGGSKVVRESEAKAAADIINAKLVAFADFEDGMVPDNSEVVCWIEHQLKKVNANVAFIPCMNDKHQDHRNVSKAAVAATRSIDNVLMYETSSTREFNPQMFVDISYTLDEKISALSMHESVRKSNCLAGEAATNLAKCRAYQFRQYGKTVEAFQVEKWKLTI